MRTQQTHANFHSSSKIEIKNQNVIHFYEIKEILSISKLRKHKKKKLIKKTASHFRRRKMKKMKRMSQNSFSGRFLIALQVIVDYICWNQRLTNTEKFVQGK